ncbi:MAG: pyridoxamine 5'-phosphate oxidase family protein [Actinomycetota bacterium]
MGPRVDTSMTEDEIHRFLDAPRTGVLSTVGPDGVPHSVGMWFARCGDEIRMWTYAKSQKAKNVRRSPGVGFLVEEGGTYSELRGVLVRGDAILLEDQDRVAEIGRLLYVRYTFPVTGVPVEDGPIEEIRRQATKRIGIALPLARVVSWDHGKLGTVPF